MFPVGAVVFLLLFHNSFSFEYIYTNDADSTQRAADLWLSEKHKKDTGKCPHPDRSKKIQPRLNIPAEEYMMRLAGTWWEINEPNYELNPVWMFTRPESSNYVKQKEFLMQNRQYFNKLRAEARVRAAQTTPHDNAVSYITEDMAFGITYCAYIISACNVIQVIIAVILLFLNAFYAKLANTTMMRVQVRRRDFNIVRRFKREMRYSPLFSDEPPPEAQMDPDGMSSNRIPSGEPVSSSKKKEKPKKK